MTRQPIDLRSDTVTQPTPEMREAIASAPVGDDMLGEDPTVNLLEERVAACLGKEAAVFTPTGSMANQIAIKVHTQPGESMLAGAHAHNFMFEAGGAGFISSIQVIIVPGDGRFSADDMRRVCLPDQAHFPPTTLVSVENTHNMGGGVLWDRQALDHVVHAARELGLARHLDGARLWNASVASGVSEREWAAGFDTVSVCFSKGLGAPVGSVLCGSHDLIRRARRVRRVLGGAMRQAGIMAAGCLHGLEHHRERLAEDHANAAFLANGLAELPGLQPHYSDQHTNILMVDTELDAPELTRAAGERGLLFFPVGPHRLRMVTHLDVDREQCARALEIMTELVHDVRAH